MKADGLFVIMAIVLIFLAWVSTGGPSRPISQAGPFITPVTRPGEESQGYRALVPANPLDTSSYPRQIPGGSGETISNGPDNFTRGSNGSSIYIDRSLAGPTSGNPNQEYVSIVNGSGAPVLLSGWRLVSRATGASVIIPNATIPANGTLTVVSGRESANQAYHQNLCESSSDACVYLNRNLELFATDHETITLISAGGVAVDAYSY